MDLLYFVLYHYHLVFFSGSDSKIDQIMINVKRLRLDFYNLKRNESENNLKTLNKVIYRLSRFMKFENLSYLYSSFKSTYSRDGKTGTIRLDIFRSVLESSKNTLHSLHIDLDILHSQYVIIFTQQLFDILIEFTPNMKNLKTIHLHYWNCNFNENFKQLNSHVKEFLRIAHESNVEITYPNILFILQFYECLPIFHQHQANYLKYEQKNMLNKKWFIEYCQITKDGQIKLSIENIEYLFIHNNYIKYSEKTQIENLIHVLLSKTNFVDILNVNIEKWTKIIDHCDFALPLLESLFEISKKNHFTI